MNPSSAESRIDPLDQLAEEFLARWRQGEQPSITEYAEKHPELAERIREFFPTLRLVEALGSVEGPVTGPFAPPPASSPLPNHLGEYRILRIVGRGGMGVVYEAVQESLGRHVALKVLPLHGAMSAPQVERFRREARAAARLHHTNIVPVFGVGEDQGVHFYAMQFIQGQSLDAVLHELRRLRSGQGSSPPTRLDAGRDPTASLAQGLLSGRFDSAPPPDQTPTADAPAPPPSAGISATVQAPAPEPVAPPSGLTGQSASEYYRSVAGVGVQVADALAYAHRQGILHRDIKPSNLLLDTCGIVWVTDFGLAKADDGDGLTNPGDIVGTLRYMAPERFEGRSDPLADVYGLGVTLYELATLRPAFDDGDRARLIERVQHEEPPRPRRVNPSVPRDLETIILKAAAKGPRDRYVTAEALADDLRRFLADRPVRARRARVPERAWRWCRRNPVVAALLLWVLLLLVVIAAGSSVSAVWLRKERDEAIKAKDDSRAQHEKALAERDRADRAEREVLAGRLGAYTMNLAKAQASRWGGQAGQRFDSLDALTKAAQGLRAARLGDEAAHLRDLRSEAIAALALTDIRVARQWDTGQPNVAALCFDARMERYALSDARGNLSVRRTPDHKEVIGLKNPGTGLHAYHLQFSPDGRYLAALHDREWKRRVWDLRSEKVVFEKQAARGFDFSPDGRRIALQGEDHAIRAHDLVTGDERALCALSPRDDAALAFDPAGGRLAVGASIPRRRLDILEAVTGNVLRSWPAPEEGVHSIAWDRDGRRLALGGYEGLITVHDAATGRVLAECKGTQGRMAQAVFHPDGKTLASTSWDGALRLWDAETGRQLVSSPGAGGPVEFGPGGQHLARLQDGPLAGLWQVVPSMELTTLRTKARGVACLAISPSGRWLATGYRDGVRLWDLAARQEVAHLPAGYASSLLFAADEQALLVCGPGGLFHWPLEHAAGEDPPALRVGPARSLGLEPVGWERMMCLAPDGKAVLVADPSVGAVVRVVPASGERSPVTEQQAQLRRLAVSPDGRWVATSTYWFPHQPIRVFDLSTGKPVRNLVAAEAASLAFSHDGKWLVTGTPAEFRFWEVGTWETRRVIRRDRAAYSLGDQAFSPDGSLLALAISRHDVQLLKAATGEELARLRAPTPDYIGAMTFSPDGGLLAVGTETGAVQLWDLRRIRAQLAGMGLDWDLRPYPPAKETPSPRPLRVEVNPTGPGR